MGQVLPRPGQPHSCPPLGRPGLGSSRPSLSPRQAAPGVTLPLCVSRACPSIQPVAPSRRAGDTLSTVSVACWEAGRVCPPLVGSPARSTAAQTLLLPLGVTSLSVPWLPHRNLLFLLGETLTLQTGAGSDSSLPQTLAVTASLPGRPPGLSQQAARPTPGCGNSPLDSCGPGAPEVPLLCPMPPSQIFEMCQVTGSLFAQPRAILPTCAFGTNLGMRGPPPPARLYFFGLRNKGATEVIFPNCKTSRNKDNSEEN